MKRNLRILSVLLAVGAVSAWAILGAHRGWTRTSVATRTVDEVTGNEGVEYRKAFVPGVDFLGAGLLVAGLVSAISFFTTQTQTKQTTSQ